MTREQLTADLARVKRLALDRLQAQRPDALLTPAEHAAIEALYLEGNAIKAQLDALSGGTPDRDEETVC